MTEEPLSKEQIYELFQRTPVHFAYFFIKLYPKSTFEQIMSASPWAKRMVKWAIMTLLEYEAIEKDENGAFTAILAPMGGSFAGESGLEILNNDDEE